MLLVDHDEASRLQLKERIAAICPPGMEVLVARSAEEGLGILYSLREQHRTIELVKYTVGVTDRDLKQVVSTQAEVLDRTDNLMINGQQVERVYISVPTDNKNQTPADVASRFDPWTR